MYIAIYKFEVIPGKEKQFISSWKALTQLIFEFEGSLGSRLHHEKDQTYIAYAQWPDQITYDNSGAKLTESASEYRKQMKEACSLH
ncbi:MAG: antibiotic biosynthesis monooxygenase [Crocinitomicaceae bacterium]